MTFTLGEVKENGQYCEDYALVKSCQVGYTRNKDPFLTIVLANKEKEVEAKLWASEFPFGYEPKELQEMWKGGTIVKFTGETNVFRDKLQLKLTTIDAVSEDKVNIENLIPTAPISLQQLEEETYRMVEEIQDPTLQRITMDLFNKFHDRFFRFPAAKKHHHAYVGGLAYHTLSMAKLATSIASMYPVIDKDVLLSGTLLHDMGKCIELSGAFDTTYTTEGNMIGHITLMVMEVDRIVQSLKEEKEIDEEKVVQLIHLIQSHHGKMEYGSPKEPMTLEAAVLHQVDMIDSSVEMYKETLKDMEEGEVEFSHPIGQVYKPFQYHH